MSKTKYYQILGVTENTSPADLKKAFEKAAIQTNPGDVQKFPKLAQAYQVLSDPLKPMIIHDQSGEDALKKGGCSSGAHRRWKMKGKDLVIPLPVSLEDLYKGETRLLPFPHTVICSKCKGKGSKSGPSMKCSGCQGSGKLLRIVNPCPPVVELPFPCDECKGTGEAIRETLYDEDRCEQCKGEKVLQLNEVLEIHIERGMHNGQMIKFPTESFVNSGEFSVYFMIEQIVHSNFIRKGDDLFMQHTLSFTEALHGFQFEFTHLDNSQVIIKSEPGVRTRRGDVKVVKDAGMPIYGNPSMRGKLHIRFTVVPGPSPQQTDMEEVETATQIL